MSRHRNYCNRKSRDIRFRDFIKVTNQCNVYLQIFPISAYKIPFGRNSGVVHAGLYYPAESLKRKFCVDGNQLLKSYVLEKGIKHVNSGKLLVAKSEADVSALERIYKLCQLNKVEVHKLTADCAKGMEPNIFCTQALWSPNTGIVDVSALLNSFEADAKESGVSFIYNCQFLNAKTIRGQEDFIISTDHGEIQCQILVNCAGLHAPFVASLIDCYPRDMLPKMYFAKGSYFKLKQGNRDTQLPLKHLIYPIPKGDGGLGIHATLSTDGNIRFGPDVEYLKHPTTLSYEFDTVPHFQREGFYAVDEERAPLFYKAIREYYPTLADNALEADYAGIRPKLVGPNKKSLESFGRDLSDFIIEGPSVHRIPGLINCYGIESPGITSSMAIANYVIKLLNLGNTKN